MHDVAVVGAGPGGGMAAWRLARAGLDVIVLERRRRVGEPIQCGEAVSEHALTTNGVDVRDDFTVRRVRGTRIISPSDHHMDILVPGLCIDRSAFDQHLVALAVGEEAELRTSTWVTRVERAGDMEGGGWTLATPDGLVRARILVLADGPASPLGRSLGMVGEGRMATAVQYKLPSSDAHRDDVLWFHVGKAFPGGYGWCFDRGRELNIGVLSTREPRALLDAYCHRLGLDPRDRLSMTRGQTPQGGASGRLSDAGVVVVGDAAGLTNPCTGGGVHAAIFSGRLASEHIVRTVETGDLAHLGEYERAVQSSPFADRVLTEARDIMDDVTDREWDALVSLGEGVDTTTLTMSELLRRAARRPRALPLLMRIRGMVPALRLYKMYGW